MKSLVQYISKVVILRWNLERQCVLEFIHQRADPSCSRFMRLTYARFPHGGADYPADYPMGVLPSPELCLEVEVLFARRPRVDRVTLEGARQFVEAEPGDEIRVRRWLYREVL